MAACCLISLRWMHLNKSTPIQLLRQFISHIKHYHILSISCSKETSKQIGQIFISQKANPFLNEETDFFRERYIPINRRAIIHLLLQEPQLLKDEEKKQFEEFSLAIDSIIINRYHGLVQELKVLYDPINPDKDTINFRKLERREELDHEFWLMQKLSVILKIANFHEIPKHVAEEALKYHDSREGVMVSVDPQKYAVLRFWALGREIPPETIPWFKSMWYKIAPSHRPPPIKYYKRLVAALRMKTQRELVLATFRDIPVNALEQLMPDSRIKMSRMDKSLLGMSMIVGGLGILATMMSAMLDARVETLLIIAGIMILISFRSWTVYKNRRNTYMVELSKMLFQKNLANNAGLLPFIVDRAEDETVKSALLVYTFLLTQRSIKAKENQHELGGVPLSVLEHNIEEWIRKIIKLPIQFESKESIKFLQSLGIVRQSREKLYVDSLETALKKLPPQQHSVFGQQWEHEIKNSENSDEEKGNDKNRKFNWQ